MYSYCIKHKSNKYDLPQLDIKFSDNDTILNPFELETITTSKNQIDRYRYNKQWERFKKITNPYELVYLNDKNCTHKSVANIEPISRSFFKLAEIIHVFRNDIIITNKIEIDSAEIMDNFPPIRTLHLCESPGGFIAAVRYLRNCHPADQHYAISIRPTNKNVPSWHKSSDFLDANPQVHILYGADDTGDIYNPENIKQLAIDLEGHYTCDLITGDGGFDFSSEFNHQEANMSKLIYCQILAALINQKEGGTLVLKIFDLNCLITYNLIYILQCYYEEIHIYKPCISRIANSEKYLVCTGYAKIPYLAWCNLVTVLYTWKCGVVSLFSENTLASEYIKKINKEIVSEQIKYIDKTIALIQNTPSKEWFVFNYKQQISTAKDWCRKYGIPTS